MSARHSALPNNPELSPSNLHAILAICGAANVSGPTEQAQLHATMLVFPYAVSHYPSFYLLAVHFSHWVQSRDAGVMWE